MTSSKKTSGVWGKLRLWLPFWLPGALLLLVGLLAIPNPTGRWTWTYGSTGSRAPWLKPGAAVGQVLPAPGRPYAFLGVRFNLKGAKTDSVLELRLLSGTSPPRDQAELQRRTLASKELSHKATRGERFFRLKSPLQDGLEPRFLLVRLLRSQGEPKVALWLDRSPDWEGKRAMAFSLNGQGRPGRPLAGHLALELGDPGEDELLLLALTGHWWGVLLLLLLFCGSLALLILLVPDPASFRRALARARLASRGARPGWPRQELRGWLPAVLVVCAVHLVLLLQTAWLSDDVYITLRSVANLAAGDGPIWNPGERVQSYTHPLWMGLLTLIQLLIGSNFAAALGLGLACSGLALYLAVFRVSRSAQSALMAAVLLSVSMAYIDYSTSGLENPLLHLLLILFVVTYLDAGHGRGALFRLWFIFALALLTRLDASLLLAPALAAATWRQLRGGHVKPLPWLRIVTLAMLPLAAWLLFSFFYYGSPLPNTAYAKLSSGIARWALFRQGQLYLLNSLAWDPVTLVVILTSAVVPVATGERRLWALVAGAWIYVFYTAWIGGCFMSGRFLTAPFLLAVLLWARLPLTRVGPALAPIMVLLAISLGTQFGVPGVVGGRASPRFGHNGIADERAYYFNERGLLSISRERDMADASELITPTVASTQTCGGAGMVSYLRGTDAYVLDPCALGDAFLARLPTMGAHTTRWRIGHFRRVIPGGYTQTLTSRQNLITSRDLGAYYERLRAVISWDLLDPRRLGYLWAMAWGSHDDLLKGLQPPDIALTELTPPASKGTVKPRSLGEGGAHLILGDRTFSRAIHITVNPTARYRLYFIRNHRYMAHREFGPSKGKAPKRYKVRVPDKAIRQGYDRLYLLPIMGRRKYEVAGLELE